MTIIMLDYPTNFEKDLARSASAPLNIITHPHSRWPSQLSTTKPFYSKVATEIARSLEPFSFNSPAPLNLLLFTSNMLRSNPARFSIRALQQCSQCSVQGFSTSAMVPSVAAIRKTPSTARSQATVASTATTPTTSVFLPFVTHLNH
jgi:hypothetical protein